MDNYEESGMFVFGQKNLYLNPLITYLEILGFRRQKSDIIFVQNLTITTIVKAN